MYRFKCTACGAEYAYEHYPKNFDVICTCPKNEQEANHTGVWPRTCRELPALDEVEI